MSLFARLMVQRFVNISLVTHSHALKSRSDQLRPQLTLALKLEGRSTFYHGGHAFVLDAGHMVLIPQNQRYDVVYDIPGDCYLLDFEADASVPDFLSIPIQNPTAFIALFERLERLWLFKKPAYLPKTLVEVYRLFALLDESDSYVSRQQYALIANAVQYLEEHYTDPNLRMEDVYAQADISQTYFRRVFKEIYHLSPIQYVTGVRIEKAKTLLRESDMTLAQIASAVGFCDPFHFSRMFRQVTGTSPGAFRHTK